MKTINRLAAAGIILYLIAWSLFAAGKWLFIPLTMKYGWTPERIAMLTVPFLLAMMLFNVAIAVWLLILARRHKSMPAVWILFSLVAGLLAPILFYAILIYDKLNQDGDTTEQSDRGDN